MKIFSSHSRARALGVCLFVAALCFALNSPANAATESLRDYVIRAGGRQAYGLYLQNHKVGWMIYEMKLENRGSGAERKEVATSRLEMAIFLARGDLKMSMKSNQLNCYELSGKGPLLYSEETDVNEGVTTKYTARPVPGANTLLVVTQRGGREVSRRKATTNDSLFSSQAFDLWLRSRPAKGATHKMYTFDQQTAGDVTSNNTYEGSNTILWGGVPIEVCTVVCDSRGTSMRMEVKTNGWPVRGRVANFLDMRAEDESLAKKMTGPPIDLLAASTILVDKDMGASKNISSLRVELTGLGEFTMPTTPRQKVVSQQNGKTVLDMQRDFRQETSTPLTNSETAENLKSTNAYPLTPAIKTLAQKIVGAEKDPIKKAGLLEHWVYANLRKSMSSNADNASDVLKARAGDCTEHSLLFVALARAAGVPAREVGGIMYAGDITQPLFGWHAWAQIHDGRQWVSIDPTWDEVWVDATHIQFSQGSEDASWISVLGSLKLKVVSFQTR